MYIVSLLSAIRQGLTFLHQPSRIFDLRSVVKMSGHETDNAVAFRFQPYRFDVKRLEVRGRKIPSAPKDEVDSPAVVRGVAKRRLLKI